ncbi:Serine Protease 47-Like, partial [Manis pentadactyla]
QHTRTVPVSHVITHRDSEKFRPSGSSSPAAAAPARGLHLLHHPRLPPSQ